MISLSHKSHEFKNIKVLQSMLSGNNRIKLEINTRSLENLKIFGNDMTQLYIAYGSREN